MIRTLTLAALTAALIAPVARAQETTTRGAQDTTRGTQDTTRGTRDAILGTQDEIRGAQGATRGAQDVTRGAQDPTAGAAGVDDRLFAAVAAIGGLSEVALSELGVQKATDPELKQFSQRMIQDHTRMNRELMSLASQKQIPLPRTVDARARFCAQSLAGLSGAKFDACYAKAQLVAHMETVSAFEAEAERGQDPDLKALAAEALPHLKEHLASIKPIAERYEREKPSTEGAAHGEHQP